MGGLILYLAKHAASILIILVIFNIPKALADMSTRSVEYYQIFFFLISKGERNIQTYKTSYYLGYMCTGIGVPFSTSQNQVIKPKKGGINEDKNVTLSLRLVSDLHPRTSVIHMEWLKKQSQQLFSFHYDINMLQMGKIVKFYLKCHIQHSKGLSQETCFIDFWLELPLYSYVQLLSGQ